MAEYNFVLHLLCKKPKRYTFRFYYHNEKLNGMLDPRLDPEKAVFSPAFIKILQDSKNADFSGFHVHSPVHLVGKDYEGRQTVVFCSSQVDNSMPKELIRQYLFNKLDPIVCADSYFLMFIQAI
jgi:hypothetical protein